MTKPIRNDAPGAVHHVTARVNWRVWHLKSRGRARFFMQALVKAAESFAVNLLAFVLMSNHFHLVLRSPEEAKYRELTGRRTRCRHLTRRELLERAGLAWSGACGITAAGHDR